MLTRALLTDLYELTMAAGYLEQGKGEDTATFELYFRRNPFHGGYAIAAGLEPAVRAVLDMRFSPDDLAFLQSLKGPSGRPLFRSSFIDYLAGFRFRGSLRGVPEGTVVFPNEPLLQVHGNLIECQVVETVLLCHLNFQTLIATKAARLWEASNHGTILEFGLRRAHGPDGGISASRASFIGGADATSNLLGAAMMGIPARGTHAHSWIQAFATELEAFEAFTRSFPDSSVLLVDTYDVLKSGVPHAIEAARNLERRGHRLLGIRIDSGDLAFLSQQARDMLDRAGFPDVKIVASNDLDEYLIADIIAQGGRIDVWGVGTKLVTASGDGGGALGGIYKIVEHNCRPKIKLSHNPEKMTNPGIKKVVRFHDSVGFMEADVLAEFDEDLTASPELHIIDPNNPLRHKTLDAAAEHVELLKDVLSAGERVYRFPTLEEIRIRRREQLGCLHESYRRMHNAHEYKVGLTRSLWQLKQRLLNLGSG